MKYVKYFWFISILILSTSYTSKTSKLTEGIYPGNLMPQLQLKNESGNKIDLTYLKGIKILVNFWSTYDSESHLNNILFNNLIKKENYPVLLVSVNFDKNKALFQKTIQIDGVSSAYQFNDTKGKDSEIYKLYNLKNGFKNYLIDQDGIISAINIEPSQLSGLL